MYTATCNQTPGPLFSRSVSEDDAMLYEGFQTSDYTTACGANFENASSPSCASFVSGQVASITNEAADRKQKSLQTSYEYMNRTIDADHQAVYSGLRSLNTQTTQQFIKGFNSKLATDTQHDIDMSRRQFEINEYYYNNKLETLFFLQLFFISALVMAILIYFNRRGTLTTQMTGIATLALLLIVIFVGVSRYFYTSRTRDRRLWNRRYFKTETGEPDSNLLKCPGAPSASPTIDLNAMVSAKNTRCISESQDALSQWAQQQNEATKRFMVQGAGAPSTGSLFAGLNLGATPLPKCT